MSKFHAIYSKGGVSPEPGGNTYGEVQTLLWTNPSIHTDFAPQTVTLDLTSYDGVIIEFNTDGTAGALGTRVKSSKTSIGAGFTSVNKEGSFSRNYVVSNSGVVFDTGYSNSNVSPGHCIPVKIYGYKQYEAGSISTSSAKEFTTAGIDCQIGEYYQLMSNSGTQVFDGFSGADLLIKYASNGAYTVICKATSTHINVGSTTSGTYCQIILNE
mgnify:CR=1 FL=1